MDANTMLKKLDRIDDLPTLPMIAMEVNAMLQDYNTSIKDLTRTIEKDQSMVPRILKLVNSAFFGLASKITSISHAVIFLGFNMVRNAVVSIAIINTLSGFKGLEDFNITDFWTHSVGVAVTSRYLAEKTRLLPTEDAFTGGLLHDIGKIVLCQYFPDLFKGVWSSSKENNLSFYEAEKKESPITHARIGGHLAKKWQLPENLIDVIMWHHDPKKNVGDHNLIMVVHAADIIINSFMINTKNRLKLSKINPDIVKVMRSELETAHEWFPGVSEEIRAACQFFLEGEEK